MNGYCIGSLRVNTRKGFLGCAGAAAMTYYFSFYLQLPYVLPDTSDAAVRNGQKDHIALIHQLLSCFV